MVMTEHLDHVLIVNAHHRERTLHTICKTEYHRMAPRQVADPLTLCDADDPVRPSQAMAPPKMARPSMVRQARSAVG
jgi:hypothetical protein